MTDIRLRPMRADDIPAAHGLSQAVSWPHRPDDWGMVLALGHGISVEDAAGTVVGTALWWPFEDAAGTMGMIIVSPALQGRGIGKRLMTALLDAAGDRPLMLNATEAGAPLYEAYGFRKTGIVNQQQGQYPGSAEPTRTRAFRPEDRDAVLALDAAAIGTPRPAVIDHLLAAGDCVVLDGPDGPTGFAIRRAFGRGDVVGPVVAASESDANELVRAAARPGFLRLDISGEATGLAAWLHGVGLDTVYPVTTMVRGNWPGAPSETRRFGLVSQALG